MNFVPIEYNGKQLLVSSDYYMYDGIRLPMTYTQALTVAQRYNAELPTADIVDAIWKQADLKLSPKPMKPGPEMTSKAYYVRHNQMIEEQIAGRNFTLIAGHKKDIIRQQRPGRVTIYGWHRLNGKPIQPVSSVHGENYYDYSHGVRLIKMC